MNNATFDTHDELIRTTDWLTENEMPMALVLIETLEPALGAEAEIFPPTFAKDASSKNPYPYNIDELQAIAPAAAKAGETVNICLIDSIGSQANRMETCFTKMPLSRLVPQITVIAKNQESKNLLNIGHRIADAAIRFSELEEDAHNAIVKLEKEHNAQDLAKLAPTSLIFGFWDSRETQFKFGRILSSIVRATNVSYVTRSAQYDAAFDAKAMFDEKEYSELGKGTNNALSALGLQDAPATGTHGGVRVFGKITRWTQVNLVGLRALAVTDENGEINEAETMKMRRYLLGLALVAARCQTNYNFREGCLLIRISEESNVVYSDGKRRNFDWNLSASFDFANTAVADFGIDTNKREIQFEVTKVRAKAEADKKKSKK